MAFDRAGFLYLTVGERQEPERAQKPGEHAGKVLRLRDDGSAPPDNPFAGRAGYLPEIYSLGHRSPQGLAVHPETGELWENEHGPLGGDEVNIIRPGRNYGWPLVTFGTDYDGTKIADATSRPDLEAPFMYWVPSIAISGLAFYTGDRFPAWKGSAFVGSMFAGRTRGTGHLQRITFTRGPADSARADADRVAPAHPRGAARSGRPAVSADRRAQRRAAEAGAGARGRQLRTRRHGPRALLRARRGREPCVLGGAGRHAASRRRCSAAAEIVFPDVEVHLDAGRSAPAAARGRWSTTWRSACRRSPAVEAAGLTVARLQQFPGVGSVMSPDGERIELFEDAATNLTFTPDVGPGDRHRPASSTARREAHRVSPHPPVSARRRGCGRGQGVVRHVVRRRARQACAVRRRGPARREPELLGWPRPVVPTKGRTLDHLAFEVRGLETFCARLSRENVTFERPCQVRAGRRSATIVDPWGASIELTEPTGRS